jgi:regulator of sigma E protease
MAGDSPRDTLTGSGDEYYSSHPLKRIFVALSGPLFNYIFAALLFIMIIMIGYEVNTYSNQIILAREEETIGSDGLTPAQKAGLQDGDIILQINGNAINNWDEITENIVRNALKPVNMKVMRNDTILNIAVVPKLDKETGRGLIGIYPWVEPVVGEIVPAEAADLAGLQEGDRIIKVDGNEILHHIDFYNALEGKAYQKIPLIIERDGRRSELILTPQRQDGYESAGLYFKNLVYRSPRYPFPIAVGKGFVKSVEGVRDTVRGIGFVVSGKIRARAAVAGPAKLIYLSGVIAKEGFVYFLQVMSYISIAFFIINLVPFPALDGSHIVISLYQVVTRKRPNLDVIHKIQAFGFIVLIVALVFVTMNDISSFFSR